MPVNATQSVMIVVGCDRHVSVIRQAQAAVLSAVITRTIANALLEDELMHVGSTIRLTFQPLDPDDGTTVVHTGDDTAIVRVWLQRGTNVPPIKEAAMFWDADKQRFEFYLDSSEYLPGTYEWGVEAMVDGYKVVEYAGFYLRA